jgi:hypothetical protein
MTVVERRIPDLPELARRIRAEYLEMPGLRLTEAQARRIWGLDELRCRDVLRSLVETRFLRQTPDGAFIRR